jgi:Glycosyltransferase family 87
MSDADRTSPSPRWMQVGGFAILVLGVCVSFAVVRGGVDFPVLYVTARGLLTGVNVYVPEQTAALPREFGVSPSGMYYPPATGFATLPLALLPYGVAKWVFAALINAGVVFGIRSLVRSVNPNAAAPLWMTLAGVVLMSAAMRWGMMLLQVAPLIFALLCWFVSLSHARRDGPATAVAAFATSLKMTLALPFVGLLALRRRWGSVALVGVLWLVLNVVGFWRMGPESFGDYQRSVARLGEVGSIDSPDLWRAVALPRLDWMPLFYSLTSSLAFSRISALLLSGGCLLWLAWDSMRNAGHNELKTAPVLGALVCIGSLAVYHHQYDAILFFTPLLLGVLQRGRNRRAGAWFTAPLVAMILLLPIGQTQGVMERLMGSTGVGLLKLSFPIVVTLALVGCLLMIRSSSIDPAG